MTAVVQIELRGVDKHYGSFHALRNVDLDIENRSFVALVGPSGCGKSTLLRSIAGLESISKGTIRIAGQPMNGVPPRKRDVAMVFQSYALYPHMTVEENLTYSLRMRRVAKGASRKAAQDVAATIGLSELLQRYPRQLSGGQRQRVAMGRAIIRQPKAFLFDEPLSNLDAALRVQMRKEIRSLHDRVGGTSVYVTHDQVEAMTMADYVVVMRDGIIEQRGTPLDLYDRPANRFVAGFIGSPAMNLLPATIAESGNAVALDGAGGQLVPIAGTHAAGTRVTAGFRPEHLVVGNGARSFNIVAGVIESTGSVTYITSEDGEITVVQSGRSPVRRGDTVPLTIDPALAHLFDPGTGVRLT